MKKLLALAGLLAAALFSLPVAAQWQVPSGKWPIGRGTGTGFYAAQGPYLDVTAPPYNAKLDGTTDDTVAIKAAITAATGKSQTVWFPCVNNNVAAISSTLELGRGVHLATCEGGTNQGFTQYTGVRLKWVGGDNVPVVKFWGAAHSSLRGFTIDCNSSSNGSNGRIGIQYASNNNPSTSFNTIDSVTVLNCHQAFVAGSPAMAGPPSGSCGPDFTLLYCAQADSLTMSRFNVQGNCNDTTASAIHVNSGNALQLSRIYQGNFQCVAVGVQIIYSNGGGIFESFAPGNMVGEKTFIKIGTSSYKYQYGPFTWIHMETEGSVDYSWRDFSDLNEGISPAYRYPSIWIQSAFNNPVSCEGNGRIISIGGGGGGIGNAWTAAGGCQVLSLYDATNTPTTAPSPWTLSGSEARLTAIGSMNTRTVVQSDNIVAGALPSGISIGVGNLATSRRSDAGRITMGSDGAVWIDRDGNLGVNIVGGYLGAGAGPSAANVGDLFSSRSTTSGALFLGSDGNKYLLRSGNEFQLAGAPFKIIPNQTGFMSALTGTNLQISGTNATDSRIQNDAFGSSAYVSLSRTNGTFASPTVLVSGNQIGGYNFYGYAGTAGEVTGPTASFRAYSNQTWSGGNLGTYAEIATTPNGSATMAGVMRFEHNGGITVPSTVTGGNMGAGTINAAGFYINGVSIGAPASMTANTVLGNATGSTAAPTNLAMPSCSTASSALIWTTSTGFGCNSNHAKQANVQTFTSSGTYTPSSGMKMAYACAFGAGGGGGGGARQAAATAVSGGGGGGAGASVCGWFTAAAIGASQAVSIGAAGTAGTAAGADNTAGGNGAAGGQTVFGTATTGPSLRAGGGGGGAGGQLNNTSGGGGGGGAATGSSATGASGANPGALGTAGGTGVASGNVTGPIGATGGGGGANGGAGTASGTSVFGGTGGGAGGGISAGNAPANGGARGAILGSGGAGPTNPATGGVAGGASPVAGSTLNATGPLDQCATGGGGGASSLTAAQAGAAGGFPCGGGGGGGSAQNGGTAGAGAAGAAGYVVVVEYF